MLNANTLKLLAGAAELVSADKGGHPDYIRAAHDANHEAQSANGMGTHATFKLDIILDSREHHPFIRQAARESASVADAATYIREYVENECWGGIPTETISGNMFLNECINLALDQVDWFKLAEHWRED